MKFHLICVFFLALAIVLQVASAQWGEEIVQEEQVDRFSTNGFGSTQEVIKEDETVEKFSSGGFGAGGWR